MLAYIYGVLNALKFISIMAALTSFIALAIGLPLIIALDKDSDFYDDNKELLLKVLKAIIIVLCVSVFSVVFIPDGTVAEKMITGNQSEMSASTIYSNK